jgi:hypothetical protein
MTDQEITAIRATLPDELPRKKTRLKSAGLFLPPDQIDPLDAIARRERKARNALMREALAEALAEGRRKSG